MSEEHKFVEEYFDKCGFIHDDLTPEISKSIYQLIKNKQIPYDIDSDNRIPLYIGLYFSNENKYEEAKKYLLISIKNGNVRANNSYAAICNILKQYDEAEKYFLVAINKGFTRAYCNLGDLYEQMKRYTDAEKYYLIAIEKGYDKSMNDLAYLYTLMEKYDESEKYYFMILEKYPKDAYNGLGILYREKKEYSKSEQYHLSAIEHGSAISPYNLGLVYNDMKRYTDALKCFLVNMKNDKDNRDSILKAADMYCKLDDYDKAEQYILEKMDKNLLKQNEEFYLKLGFIMKLKNFKYKLILVQIDKPQHIEQFNCSIENEIQSDDIYPFIENSWHQFPDSTKKIVLKTFIPSCLSEDNCEICFEKNHIVNLTCHATHELCTKCVLNMNKCPFCRTDF